MFRQQFRCGLLVGTLLVVVASFGLPPVTAVENPPADEAESPAKPGPDAKTDANDKPAPQNAVRQIFRPTTTKSGKTSWTALFSGPGKDEKRLTMIVHAHRGDRWPVKYEARTETLFEMELIDGDEHQVELKILDGGKDRRLVAKLDKAEKVLVAGKEFIVSYGTTEVAGTEPQYVDEAVLFVTTGKDD